MLNVSILVLNVHCLVVHLDDGSCPPQLVGVLSIVTPDALPDVRRDCTDTAAHMVDGTLHQKDKQDCTPVSK